MSAPRQIVRGLAGDAASKRRLAELLADQERRLAALEARLGPGADDAQRVTEDGAERVTEDGERRIVEQA